MKYSNMIKISSLLPFLTLLIICCVYFSGVVNNSTFNSFDWSNISMSVKDTCRKVIEYGELARFSSDKNSEDYQQLNRQFWLMKNASKEELEALTEIEFGVLRYVAHSGLIRFDTVNSYQYALNALNDTTQDVYYISGCTSNNYLVGEFIGEYMLLLNNNIPKPSNEYYKQFNLTALQLEDLKYKFKILKDKKHHYLNKIYASK